MISTRFRRIPDTIIVIFVIFLFLSPQFYNVNPKEEERDQPDVRIGEKVRVFLVTGVVTCYDTTSDTYTSRFSIHL